VRIDVRPSAVGGPDFYHEIPIMVGSFNQVVDHDEDFRDVKAARGAAPDPDQDDTNKDKDDDGDSPTPTLPDDEDEDEDE
jgi:hypothetical protein